jgi:hypothetical protein
VEQRAGESEDLGRKYQDPRAIEFLGGTGDRAFCAMSRYNDDEESERFE